MINKILKTIFAIPLFSLFGFIIIINWRVHYLPEVSIAGADTINLDVLANLRGLKSASKFGADSDMQDLYPEGYIFFNALYGLAWCNFLQQTSTKEFFEEGHHEIQTVWNKINSVEGRRSFSEDLPLSYGAFYTGWSTYVLGRKLSVETPGDRHKEEVIQFKQQCEKIEAAITEHIFPVSYYGSAWPADAMVCVAALSLHDKLFVPKYSASITEWVKRVKQKCDTHGLIPHATDPVYGSAIVQARGSSQSLMLVFLKDIDKQFAMSQFKLYRTCFVDTRFGITGLREYPKGKDGVGDVDSGPVIFQLGSAATIVGMQTMSAYGEDMTATKIRNAVEGMGISIQHDGEKTYLFGSLPMADAFITWGQSSMHKTDIAVNFMAFHVYSLLVGLILIVLILLFFKPKKTSSEKSLHIPW